MSGHYNRRGEPIGVDEWGQLFEDREYQSLAKTQLGAVLVSTVWMGIDHSLGFGPPIIFETMVFGLPPDDDDDEYWDGNYCVRYSTEQAAMDGHECAVMMVRNKIGVELE